MLLCHLVGAQLQPRVLLINLVTALRLLGAQPVKLGAQSRMVVIGAQSVAAQLFDLAFKLDDARRKLCALLLVALAGVFGEAQGALQLKNAVGGRLLLFADPLVVVVERRVLLAQLRMVALKLCRGRKPGLKLFNFAVAVAELLVERLVLLAERFVLLVQRFVLLAEQFALLVELSDAGGQLVGALFEPRVFFFEPAGAVAESRLLGDGLLLALLLRLLALLLAFLLCLVERLGLLAQLLILFLKLGQTPRRGFVIAPQRFALDLKLPDQPRQLRDRVFKLKRALAGGFLKRADAGALAVETGAQAVAARLQFGDADGGDRRRRQLFQRPQLVLMKWAVMKQADQPDRAVEAAQRVERVGVERVLAMAALQAEEFVAAPRGSLKSATPPREIIDALRTASGMRGNSLVISPPLTAARCRHIWRLVQASKSGQWSQMSPRLTTQ